MSYQAEYDRSMNDPEGFWKEKSEALKWFKAPEKISCRKTNTAFSIGLPMAK